MQTDVPMHGRPASIDRTDGAVPDFAVPALFARLVDDAGLFPPEELSMPDAVARHRADDAAAEPVLTGRFLCPAASLGVLADALLPSDRFSVAVITPLTAPAVRRAVATVAGEPRLALAGIEGRVDPGNADVVAAVTGIGVPCFVEVPLTAGWDENLAALAQARLSAKVRCGGLTADLFPTVEDLAAFITECVRLGVPFKATAGLHNAVRHTDPATGFTHHGFLNLLLATCRAVTGGGVDRVVEVLACVDATVLVAEARRVPDETAVAARQAFVSYGSCSTREPVADLRSLGLIGGRAAQ